MRKIKIALVTRSLTRGGVQVQIVNFARELKRRGHQVSVIVFYDHGPLQAQLESDGVPVLVLGNRGRWNLIATLFRYLAIAQSEEFDVIYSFLPLQNLLSLVVARLTGATVVWGLRCAAVDTRQHGWASRFLYWAQRRLIFSPDHVISNSRAAIDELGCQPGDHFTVIPNGIDIHRFKPDPVIRSAMRKELGIADSEKLVGCVARIDSMKDHATALRAAAIVRSRRRDIRFAVVGSGDAKYCKSLNELATQLGLGDAIAWYGERPDVERVMNALDAYTSASVAEGFSNALGEAMACGVIPAVTDAGDNAALVGEHGTVIPMRSPERLADAIVASIDRDTPAARNERRNWIVQKFSVDRMVDASLQTLAIASLSTHSCE